jgi:hypothetical protein
MTLTQTFLRAPLQRRRVSLIDLDVPAHSGRTKFATSRNHFFPKKKLFSSFYSAANKPTNSSAGLA